MQPSTVIERLDLSISYAEFSLRANRRGYIGLRALPALGVGLQASKFSVMPIEQLLGPTEDTVVAPNGSYSRQTFTWKTDSYSTDDHGVEEVLGDRQVKIARGMIPAEFIAAERAINRVLQAYEAACASAVFNTSTFSNTGTVAAWDTASSGKPINDIDVAWLAVKAACGMRPNALILSDIAYRHMIRTAQVSDLMKYSGRDAPTDLGAIAGLKELFMIEHILVADGMENTSNLDATASLSRFWDATKCMVCRIAEVGDADIENPDPNIGRTIMWQEENASIPGPGEEELGVIVEDYREERTRGGILRARNDRHVKIIQSNCGYIITGVTT